MRHTRAGFTKLDLVFSIILFGVMFMLFALWTPGKRGVARQIMCMNNMAVNLGKAHLRFHQQNNRFCGYVNSVGPDHKCVSWVVPLFAYIDRPDLANAWNGFSYDWEDEAKGLPAKMKHPDTYIEVLICPTNPPVNEKTSPLSYVVNGGYAEDTQPKCAHPGEVPCASVAEGTGENLANGMFHDQYGPSDADGYNPQIARAMTLQYVVAHDGASRTVMLSENLQLVSTWYTTGEQREPLAMIWWQTAATPDTATHRINFGKAVNLAQLQPPVTRKDFARPSSFHAHGVNMAFGDGHGKFISEMIDYAVYKQLMTPAGENSDDQENLAWNDSLY